MKVKKYTVHALEHESGYDIVEDPNGEFIKAEDFEAYLEQMNLDVLTQGLDSLHSEVRGDEEGYDVTLDEIDKVRDTIQGLI